MSNEISKKIPPEEGPISISLEPTHNGFEMKIKPYDNSQSVKKIGEAYITVDGNDQPINTLVSFDKQKLLLWIDEGKIDQSIGQTIIEAFDDHEHLINLAKKDSGDKNDSEHQQVVDFIRTKSEKTPKQVDAIRHLLGIKDLLEADKLSPLFKKNVNPVKSFGVTKALMDRLKYLPELLKNSKLIYPQEGSNIYKISSTYLQESGNGVGKIGLEYTLHYMPNITPEKAFKNYIKEMLEDALKAFLAYWDYANIQGSFLYHADIVDIMNLLADQDRKSYFNSKDKRRFWYLSQLLKNTYLTITIKHKNKYLKVEHPLLKFEGTLSDKEEQEINDGYPKKVIVRVLNPDNFQEAANLATEISKKTLKLASKDILLALTVQIRASQRRESQDSTYDKQYLIEQALLQKTQAANPRVATRRLEEKLERQKKTEITDDWKKISGNRYLLKHKKNNKKAT